MCWKSLDSGQWSHRLLIFSLVDISHLWVWQHTALQTCWLIIIYAQFKKLAKHQFILICFNYTQNSNVVFFIWYLSMLLLRNWKAKLIWIRKFSQGSFRREIERVYSFLYVLSACSVVMLTSILFDNWSGLEGVKFQTFSL